MQRKGFAFDSVILIILVGIMLVCAVVGKYVFSQLSDAGLFSSETADFTPYGNQVFGTIDTGMLIIVGGFGIAMILSALMIKTHPVVFVVFFIISIFVIAASGPISNVYMAMVSSSPLTSTANEFTTGLNIAGNLPIWIFAFILIAGVVMFAKIGGYI